MQPRRDTRYRDLVHVHFLVHLQLQEALDRVEDR